MARDINLGTKPKLPPVPAAPVAATTQKTLNPIPPPASSSNAFTGTPPMPEGRVVGAFSPSSLTPAEQQMMANIGWTEDVPIPSNMRDILTQVVKEKRAASATTSINVDPRTPPITLKPRPLSDLNSEEKARVLEAMRNAFAEEQAQKALQSQHEALKAREQSVPGINAAMKVAEQVAARQSQPSNEPIVDDRTTQPSTPSAAPSPSPTPVVEKVSETGANPHPAFCPHCLWDLAAPIIPEPPYADKMSFLHSLLGEKPWTKEVELFGGNVKVLFRTLTIQEIDAVYRQAYNDRSAGRIPSENDFWERINRYRLFLQIQSMRSAGSSDGFSHDLPDGLSKETNPGATGVWSKIGDDFAPDETPLLRIERWITDNVLKNEAIFRVVSQASNQFNRLVAKMEAMADNSDFWQPTGVQS